MICRINNLNSLIPRTLQGEPFTGCNGQVTVHFSDLENRLIEHISAAQIVVGCVAWLTHWSIIQALSHVPGGVSIIVQKEEFLRPDIDSSDNWRKELKSRYSSLRSLKSWPGLLNILTEAVIEDYFIDAVRCVGINNRANAAASPRMHHKFLVFCRLNQDEIEPYAVWTGSFNLTLNAVNSFENALVLSDSKIADAYFEEWQQMAFISESLNWQYDWVQPEWSVT